MANQKIGTYEPLKIEPKVLKFWRDNKINQKTNEKNLGGKTFYFLDGPPYTSGKIHLGTAWNKSLKDCILRYKRMQGFEVYDRACYDMHGLPIEHKVEAKFGIKNKDEIPEFGVEKYITECRKFSIENMNIMSKDFERLGSSLDYSDPYTPITQQSIEAIWWLLGKAHEQKRLYPGKRPMTWCPTCATALAKHELEYENLKEASIYFKFPVKGAQNEHLIIWTTTPWTIPFNQFIMLNPEITYIKAQVENEVWIVARVLADHVIKEVAQKEYTILETFKGEVLDGVEYEHPYHAQLPQQLEMKTAAPKMYTVIMTKEYVDTSAGTGIVHAAAGTGVGADYEVAHENKITPWSEVDDNGYYLKTMGPFFGLRAKFDDDKIIAMFEEKELLAGKEKYTHEYPHCWRCHKPAIFKTTTQWFFKVEDLKEEMIRKNRDDIKWVPHSAFNAFDAWLKNLRDNSITKQRYWGTPIPVWQCDDETCKHFEVLTTKAEIEQKCEIELPDLHKPWIDRAEFACNKEGCSGTMKRIPDVMDVWIDPGCISWTALGYPRSDELFNKFFPADFILEGKDQIRGWFNVLMVCSTLAMRKISFKNVYMHGFVQDSQGRKMSKSLGNVISPSEVVDQYGADTFRFYAIGGAKPMLDLNYNPDDLKLKHKNLMVIWNVHKLLIEMKEINALDVVKLSKVNTNLEDHYILSRLHSTIKKATEKYDAYQLNEIPILLENLFLELSRTYIQSVRERFALGNKEVKQVVMSVIYEVFFTTLKMFSTIAPFISEEMYQNMKAPFDLKEESIHLLNWPQFNEKDIDAKLESDFEVAKDTIQSILSAREKIQLGVRWPVKEAVIISMDENLKNVIRFVESVIKTQTNVKEVKVVDKLENMSVKIKPNYKKLGPDFGDQAPKIISALLSENDTAIANHLEKEGSFKLKTDGQTFELTKEHLLFEETIPSNFSKADYKHGTLVINTDRTPELDAEGYAREIMRRVQIMRKENGLKKNNRINLSVSGEEKLMLLMTNYQHEMKEKCGVTQLDIGVTNKGYKITSTDRIKNKSFEITMEILN